MADSIDLTPQELDRIEDLLEQLPDGDLPGELTTTARERLAAYSRVLTVTREALPDEDVPAGVLERVLTEARAVAGSTATLETGAATGTDMIAPVEEPARPGGWRRFRRSFLPAFALATSAAAVLWWIRPESGIDTETVPQAAAPITSSPTVAERAQNERAAEMPVELAPAEAGRREVEATDDPGAIAPARRSEGDELGPMGTGSVRETRKARAKNSDERSSDLAPTSKPMAGAASPPAAPPPPKGDHAGEVSLAEVESADGKRRSGRCGSANLTYANASRSADPTIAARGFAGLGLCAEQKGESGTKYFEQAKKNDPLIDRFISAERARAYRGGGSTAKKKAAPAAYDGLESGL